MEAHCFGTRMCAGRGLPSHKYEFVLDCTVKRKYTSKSKYDWDNYSSKTTDDDDFSWLCHILNTRKVLLSVCL